MKDYIVKFKISGDYEVKVRASNEPEARSFAALKFMDANFGELKNPEGPIIGVETNKETNYTH